MAEDKMQQRITENVRVLMALRRIGTQRQLGAKLGMGTGEVSRKFSGRVGWQLGDLTRLAEVFGVEPYDLLRPVADLVNAAARGTGTDGPVSAGREMKIGVNTSWLSPGFSPSPPLSRPVTELAVERRLRRSATRITQPGVAAAAVG